MQLSIDGKTLLKVKERHIVGGTYQIPAGVNTIGFGAFFELKSLQALTLPASIKAIGETAFFGCTNLQAIDIPDGVTTIGYLTFTGCRGLKTLTLPTSITSISKYAFAACDNLYIIIASDDKAEVARVTALLPKALRSKVITQSWLNEIIRFQEQQLTRLLHTPQTNRLYSFFNYTSRCVSMVSISVKNEQDVEETQVKRCTKLPSDIFLHLNRLASNDNPYYQRACIVIRREPLPRTTEAFKRYKERIGGLIQQLIDQAIKQARQFSVSIAAQKKDGYEKAFHQAHTKRMCKEYFQFFRKTTIKGSESLSDILAHAAAKDNRSRKVCVKLGWLNKDGSVKESAPDKIRENHPNYIIPKSYYGIM
ncbi:Uncharacterised protein [Legionella beliardensis]|uniref:Leucine-rich repeat domain-containing protein n=1 Tax=Legionella beliardensis TaxID=91822 RepID=A0A378JPS6_9GAMM|nr:leucine-rich repeat domain-containing protein [Legionella beliardensis]STX55606.1 Uncharacterised protein [Legionella beliardensis]